MLEKYKKVRGFDCSLARYFDYDIWIVLDPDRIHHEDMPHIREETKRRIPLHALHGGIPLNKPQDYDHSKLYEELPEGGFFDGFGLYYYPWPGNPDYYNFLSPLEHIQDKKVIEDYPVPLLNQEDIDCLKNDVSYIKSSQKMCASYSGSLYEWSYYLRGRERIYFDFYDRPDLVELIVEKIAGFVELLAATNLKCGVDILCFYDDLGAQTSLQFDPEMFRRFYKPFYKKIWSSIKEKNSNAYVFLHACGNISEIIPDLIECGLDILHPLQPETMDVYALSSRYAKDLVFWGTMSNQYTLTRGSKDDIVREVRERIEKIGSTGRLILGSSNTLGRDVPVQNIDYFREACMEYCGHLE